METTLAILVGILTAAGIYLLLRRSMLRMLFGLILISNAVNILILTAGGVRRGAPPLVEAGNVALGAGAANPLPQALILTAIVIGFGLIAFALVLVYRTYTALGTMDADIAAEKRGEAA
ncbi:cation:proton antiporter [Longibacter salinarum]|uniref:Cation:proton antiporter n=1 Tax=Longibacter salinarum TaxID=1850348 RepID=A0A2A8D1K3_9BACT|nr:NADH-quinone oxidoreductase subunit K [Longibacter salinarum]PEN14839.1 cation:proton antiporter [Longibacter salinarum]